MCMRHDITELSPKNIEEAKEIQHILRERVRIEPLMKSPALVAGVDAAFFDDEVAAAASLFAYPEMRHLQDSLYRGKATFPYVPGFLSFREGPACLEALDRLEAVPDVILIDGQGIAHPRGAGMASHLGVIMNAPTIGCAKSRLIGEFEQPGRARGDWSYLYREKGAGIPVGAVVRTRTDVRPVFVSPGHLIDIVSSVGIVLGCASGYRIPEPLRRADRLSRQITSVQR